MKLLHFLAEGLRAGRALSVPTAGIALAILPFAGCRTTPAPPAFEKPFVTGAVSHYGGSPLSGKRILPEPPDRSTFIPISLRFLALEDFPDDRLSPLSERASLILNDGTANPLLSTGRLTRAVRTSLSEEEIEAFENDWNAGVFGESPTLANLSGAVAPGITSRYALKSLITRKVAGWRGRIRESVELEIHLRNTARKVQVAISLHGFLQPTPSDTSKQALATFSDETTVVETEVARGSNRALLVLPSPFSSASRQYIAALVDWSPPPQPSAPEFATHQRTVDRCLREISKTPDESSLAETENPDNPPAIGATRSAVQSGLLRGLEGLDHPSSRRSSVAFLARATGAALAEDLALSASEVVVEDLCRSVEAPLASARHVLDEPTLGWILERSSFLLLARLREQETLPPSLDALLVDHAGEAGRSETLIEDVIGRSQTLEQLHEEWGRENLIFLEDRSPAARLRAYDWLLRRGETLDGYEPLGSREDRREAVRRLLASEEEAEETQS